MQAIRDGKYSRVERERRFLLAQPPPESAVTGRRQVTDRYLHGTRLRLRRFDYLDGQPSEFKFTQKVAAERPGYVQGLITTSYLSAAEYDVLATLPARVLSKMRVSVGPLSVDIFDPPLHGLVLAEVEFSTDEAAGSFAVLPDAVAEVTEDARFTGGNLVRTRRGDLVAWLAGYGINAS